MSYPYYTEPDEYQPCFRCAYSGYDSFHEEMYCRHRPSPDGLQFLDVIGPWGHCDYWKPEDPLDTDSATGEYHED